MKKSLFAILLLFLCFGFSSGNVAFAQERPVYVVVANKADVFAEANFDSEVLVTLAHGTEFFEGGDYDLEFSSTTPTPYYNGDQTFFKVMFDESEGYIFSELVAFKTESIESIPNFNAKTNSSCKVYCADDTVLTLEKGHRIYLYEKYDSHSKRTNIAFLYENKVMYGQIETKFVDPDGINPILISAFIIIVAVLGIIFAWLFMKNKRKK